jgi:hypothetical protein
MTTINDKMGLRRAGKRRMMANLPKTRADAAKITAAICPSCQYAGKAKLSATQPGQLYCTWCHTLFELPEEPR